MGSGACARSGVDPTLGRLQLGLLSRFICDRGCWLLDCDMSPAPAYSFLAAFKRPLRARASRRCLSS